MLGHHVDLGWVRIYHRQKYFDYGGADCIVRNLQPPKKFGDKLLKLRDPKMWQMRAVPKTVHEGKLTLERPRSMRQAQPRRKSG
jgi:hypothetical protein